MENIDQLQDPFDIVERVPLLADVVVGHCIQHVRCLLGLSSSKWGEGPLDLNVAETRPVEGGGKGC